MAQQRHTGAEASSGFVDDQPSFLGQGFGLLLSSRSLLRGARLEQA
jgi:hypothetical protein